MRIEIRPVTAAAMLLVVLVAISAGPTVTANPSTSEGGAAPHEEMVALTDGSELWPHTSRAPAFDQRTLAVNIVVYGDAEATETLLRESVTGDWRELDEEEKDVAPAENTRADVDVKETAIAWGGATGATRYVYVDTPADGGQWLTESYQLEDGAYLGARHHIRGYADPAGGEWTAIQAHGEHWDWFHLRHTVHSVERSQLFVEEEFVERWYVEGVTRERFGNGGVIDANGWTTVVDLDGDAISLVLGFLVLGSFGTARWARRWEQVTELRHDGTVRTGGRTIAVVAALVGLYAAVRLGAVGLETLFPAANPKLIVALLYPVLVTGMPAVAYLLSRQLETCTRGFAAGAVGFAVAVLLDYTFLGVTSLPIDTFVHRIALAAAVGFIAAGATQQARGQGPAFGHLRTGVLLWLVALAIPLLQFV